MVAEQSQASEVHCRPTPNPPSSSRTRMLTMGPSSTHLMGNLMQEDGHGGQETDLQEGESKGVCTRGQGTPLSSLPIFTLL